MIKSRLHHKNAYVPICNAHALSSLGNHCMYSEWRNYADSIHQRLKNVSSV